MSIPVVNSLWTCRRVRWLSRTKEVLSWASLTDTVSSWHDNILLTRHWWAFDFPSNWKKVLQIGNVESGGVVRNWVHLVWKDGVPAYTASGLRNTASGRYPCALASFSQVLLRGLRVLLPSKVISTICVSLFPTSFNAGSSSFSGELRLGDCNHVV